MCFGPFVAKAMKEGATEAVLDCIFLTEIFDSA